MKSFQPVAEKNNFVVFVEALINYTIGGLWRQ